MILSIPHVLSLLLVCSLFRANCESICSIPVLKNRLQKLSAVLSSSNHEILFVSFNLRDCNLNLNLSVYMLINSNVNDTAAFHNTLKHRQPFHTIIKSEEGIIEGLLKFGMQVSTLLIGISGHLSEENKFNWKNHFSQNKLNWPSIKLILSPIKTNQKLKLKYSVLCNAYCDEESHTGILNEQFFKCIENPITLHRKLFRLGNQRQVDAFLYAVSDSYFIQYAHNKLACWDLVFHPNFRKCSPQIMSSILLHFYHNISINLSNKHVSSTWRDSSWQKTSQHLVNSVSFEEITKHQSHHLQFRRLTGLKFSKFYEEKLIYCLTHEMASNAIGIRISFSTWTDAFSLDVWGITFATVIAVTIYESAKKVCFWDIRILIDVLGSFIGANFSQNLSRGQLLIIFHLVGFLVCTLNGNEILSLLTIPNRPKLFSTIKEILISGYKIIWPRFFELDPVQWNYPVFKTKSLLDFLNGSFHTLEKRYTFLDYAKLFTQKYMCLRESQIEVEMQRLKNAIVNNVGLHNAECYILPEIFTTITMDNDFIQEFKCPVCFEIPPKEIYQFRLGHTVCNECSENLTDCPQCRVRLGSRRIRNLALESVLDKQLFDCPFKSQGCSQTLTRGLMFSHMDECPFRPYSVKLCKELGYSCEYMFDPKSLQKALAHFEICHNIMSYEETSANIILDGIEEAVAMCENIWTPIIFRSSSPEEVVWMFYVHLNTKEKSISIFSINLMENTSNLKPEFKIPGVDSVSPDIVWRAPLKELKSEGQWFPEPTMKLPIELLRSNYTTDSSLSIICFISGNVNIQFQSEIFIIKLFRIASSGDADNRDEIGVPISTEGSNLEPLMSSVEKERSPEIHGIQISLSDLQDRLLDLVCTCIVHVPPKCWLFIMICILVLLFVLASLFE